MLQVGSTLNQVEVNFLGRSYSLGRARLILLTIHLYLLFDIGSGGIQTSFRG
jgi:hypothetical protein